MLELRIRRFDTTIALPEYKTDGAAAFDLSSRIDTEIAAGAIEIIPLNVAIQLPDGYCAQLIARSSLFKKGLRLINGVGVFDADYSGNTDEYRAALQNFSSQSVSVTKGERLAQVVILPLIQCAITEVTELSQPNRGGFGTTGTH